MPTIVDLLRNLRNVGIPMIYYQLEFEKRQWKNENKNHSSPYEEARGLQGAWKMKQYACWCHSRGVKLPFTSVKRPRANHEWRSSDQSVSLISRLLTLPFNLLLSKCLSNSHNFLIVSLSNLNPLLLSLKYGFVWVF